MWKRLRTAGLLTLISLILLEVVLQVLALGIWLFFPRHEAVEIGAGDRAVMCIGDSFTFGLGASSLANSYPDQLQAIMQERHGPEWRVVNRGWPGRCTRDLLERIDEQLAAVGPEVVYVVAGLNDQFSTSSELVLAEGVEHPSQARDDSLRWEWRTAKLFRIFSRWAFGSDVGDLAASLTGTWVGKAGEVCRFRPDGSVTIQGQALAWRLEDRRLVLSREGAPFASAVVDLEGDVLVLTTGEQSELALYRVQDVEPSELQRRLAAEMSANNDGSAGAAKLIPETELDRIVDSHLDQLVRRCKAAGADVVLATYPHQSPHALTVRRVAARHDITLLDIHAGFSEALAAQPDLDLFVPDAHCNDDGYRLMAEIVARDVATRVGPR